MPRKKSQNKNSGYKDKLFRIDAELAADLESIAEEQGTSQTTIVHEALKLYRDKRYMSEKASALPSELTETLLAANALAALLNLLGNVDEVDARATAGRAGNQLHAAAKAKRF